MLITAGKIFARQIAFRSLAESAGSRCLQMAVKLKLKICVNQRSAEAVAFLNSGYEAPTPQDASEDEGMVLRDAETRGWEVE